MSTIIEFGETGYYVKIDGKGFSKSLPARLLAITRNESSKKYSMSLGLNDSFFISYQNRDGEDDYEWEFGGHYKKLDKWLRAKDRDVRKIQVALGPDGSYWASAGRSQSSNGLPTDMKNKLDELKDESHKIQGVALGVDGSYVILYGRSGATWNLRGQYPDFQEILDARKEDRREAKRVGPISYISLSAYNPEYFFVSFEGGENYWAASENWSERVEHLLAELEADGKSVKASKSRKKRSTRVHASRGYENSADAAESSYSGGKKEGFLAKNKDNIGTMISVGQFIMAVGGFPIGF